jgi:hypothetical protein
MSLCLAALRGRTRGLTVLPRHGGAGEDTAAGTFRRLQRLW